MILPGVKILTCIDPKILKYKSGLLRIIKLAVFIAISYVIYRQSVFLIHEWQINSPDWEDVHIEMLLIAIIGTFFNLLLESIKWWKLSQRIEKLTYVQTLKSVFAGTALSIITPQRSGDLLGRLVGFHTHNYPGLIAVQILGGVIQIAVVLMMGGISLFCLNSIYNWIPVNSYTVSSAIIFALFLLILQLGIFKTSWTLALAKKIPLKGKLKEWIQGIHVIKTFSNTEIVFLYVITLLRYLVYTSQFLILLEFLGQPALNWLNLGAVYLLFFIQAGVPLPPLFSLVIRGSIALQVWSMVHLPGFNPLIASYLLWLMNLGVPSIVGALVIMYFKRDNND